MMKLKLQVQVVEGGFVSLQDDIGLPIVAERYAEEGKHIMNCTP